MMSLTALHPHIVREEPGDPPSVNVLGHGLAVELKLAGNGFLMGFPPEVLDEMKLTPAAAYLQSLKNLERLAAAGMIPFVVAPGGPASMTFFVSAGHWASADALLLPGLAAQLSKALGSEELCASVPHRNALFVFPLGTSTSREAMRDFIQRKEGDADPRRRLTPELFRLTATRVEPI